MFCPDFFTEVVLTGMFWPKYIDWDFFTEVVLTGIFLPNFIDLSILTGIFAQSLG